MGSKDIGTTMIKSLYKFNCVVEHMMSIVAAYIYRYLGYATYAMILIGETVGHEASRSQVKPDERNRLL